MTNRLLVHGTARLVDVAPPELLRRLADAYLGPGVTFPPFDNLPSVTNLSKGYRRVGGAPGQPRAANLPPVTTSRVPGPEKTYGAAAAGASTCSAAASSTTPSSWRTSASRGRDCRFGSSKNTFA